MPLPAMSAPRSGHAPLLAHLGKEPLLSLDLRLGEGSGAALAIGILQGGGGLPFRHGHLCRGGCVRGG